MFASCGYFRGLTCPYFQSGLCERPYCHFRHVKEKERESTTSTSDKLSISVEGIGNIISPNLPNDSYFQKNGNKKNESEEVKYINNVEEEEENGGELVVDAESMEQKEEIAFPAPNPSFQPVYKPTPKSEMIPRDPNDPLPEYCPTPIPELKKMHKTLPINLEYDPVSNYKYSLKEKEEPSQPTYAPIKRSLSNDSGEFPVMKQIKLDQDPENGEKSEYIVNDEVCDSDEDEVGNAQFSDDTDDMNELNECKEENSFEEFFDTKSYARDTVRDKDTESLIPNKFKKFDVVSGNLGSESSENDRTKKSQKQLSDKENLRGETSRNSKEKSSSQSLSSKLAKNSKDIIKSSEMNHKHSNAKNSVKSSSSSLKKNSSSSTSSSHKSSSSHLSSRPSSHKSSSSTVKNDTRRHSSSEGTETQKSKTSSGKSEHSKLNKKCDKSNSDTKERHGSSSGLSGSKSPRSSSSTSSSKTNGKADSKSDKHHSSSDKLKSSNDRHHSDFLKSSHEKHHSDVLKKHHSSGEKVKSSNVKRHSVSDKSKSTSSKHHSSSDRYKSSSDKHHCSNIKTSSKSSQSSSSSKTKHNSGSHSDSSKSKYENDKSPKGSNNNSKPNKRYSIEDIHTDLFGDTEESDNDVESVTEEPAADMPDSEIFQYLDESDFSDADTYEECLKIFNETTGLKSKSPVKKDVKKKPETTTEDSVGKKRLAYEAASKVVKKPVEKAKTILSPAQVMHNRIIAMQKQALEAAAARKAASETPTATAPSASSAITSFFGGSKKRVAHEAITMNNKTQAITASKSEKRQQHTPTIKNLKRPTVPAEYGSKVPTAIRQRYLNLIIDECLKFIKDEETAFKRGQEEEHVAYGRSSNKNIYLRMAVNTIKRLRTEADAKNNSPKKVSANAQSHEATLGGSRAAKTSFTIKRSGAHQMFFGDFTGAELYQRLSKYVTSEEDLQTNNYPRPDSNSSSSAKFYVDNDKVKDPTLKDYEKNCNRCGRRFVVYPDCEYGSFEECSFHWGKAWKRKVAGQWETRYTCCSGDLSATGCAVSKAHTYESNKYENITGYMKTMPTSPPLDGNYGVYAMDCEMVYTTGGMELARVTVIGSDKQPVYETLVQPDYPLIDPNTRFSGIEEKDLQNVKTTLRNVQAVLLSLFNDKTILLGHSLESDLMAVKIIHNTVVDTSLVFPHRLGLPYKRALRNLMSEHLQKIIQNDEGGHDSNEDALACLELMQWKLKENAKKEQRRS